MEWALLTTALLMGLAGGAHCLAMCSPACAAVARGCAGVRPPAALLAVLAGRALSYAAAGAVVAAGVGALGAWAVSAAWLRPLWSMLHLAAFALGAWLLWAGRQPAWMASIGSAGVAAPANGAGSERVSAPVPVRLAVRAAIPESVPASSPRSMPGSVHASRPGGTSTRRNVARATLAGSLLVLLPCGLLQSALLVAALASTPPSGALVMLAFALASSLSLWAGPALWLRVVGGERAARWRVGAVRLSGLMLAAASVWALAHHWGMAGQAAFCVVP
jgi:uncharacterized protein